VPAKLANPRGEPDPYVSPEGHNILDINYCAPSICDVVCSASVLIVPVQMSVLA
jgi:hypothetical protein